jgi:outer membrane protein assembly factor BamB
LLHAHLRILRRLAGILATSFALLTATAGPSLAWQTAHGKPDNSGAVDVETAPAINPLPNAPRLGGVAPGAGPVIAPDGTVYVVNGRGKLMSFKPDGTPGWSRDIATGGVLSSPVLGSDGSIYFVAAATIRDNRTNPPTTTHIAELHKFTSGGGYVWHVPLPGAAGGLTTSAPPNIWRAGGYDVIMVPTVRRFGGFEARLTAFSENGAVLADQIVKTFSPETTGGAGWKWYEYFKIINLCYWIDGCDFSAPLPGDPVHLLPYKMRAPFPAVAVYNPATNNVPLVMMSDGFQDLVGYFFNGNSFMERFRVRDDNRYLVSTPLAWPDGHAMISTGGRSTPSEVMFAGLQMSTIRAAGPLSWAAPTALGNSRFALVHRHGGVTVMRGASIETTVKLPGESIASAAASRNHVFVSTASALHTFDKSTMAEVVRFDWQRGGTSPVAIGPSGHVYAIADDRLFVFKPPLSFEVVDTNGGGIFQDGGTPTPQTAQSQTYKPPLTANNNRLFACEKLDGDDCGKGDYRSIAKAFCSKQGFAEAADIKVDSEKVKAETLDGQFCSKKKCKVFEQIVCKM